MVVGDNGRISLLFGILGSLTPMDVGSGIENVSVLTLGY